MLVFVKLGGSLITDKQVESSFHADVMTRLAREIRTARETTPGLRLLLGHGSGSFGHVAAKRYGTMQGVHTADQWHGFAHVATVASQLSQLVANVLDHEGIPVWRLQPSASALSHDVAITQLAVEPIAAALDHDIVPLVHGDVALDDVRGGTIISTETIFFYLATRLPVSQILLLGEVEGVYDAQGKVIPAITPANFDAIESALGGSAGTDVTGGMETKVRDMLALVESAPQLTIRIMSGTRPDLLEQTLMGDAEPGTVIRSENPTSAG